MSPLGLCLCVANIYFASSANLFQNPDFEDVSNVLQWGTPYGYNQDLVAAGTAKSGGHFLSVHNR